MSWKYTRRVTEVKGTDKWLQSNDLLFYLLPPCLSTELLLLHFWFTDFMANMECKSFGSSYCSLVYPLFPKHCLTYDDVLVIFSFLKVWVGGTCWLLSLRRRYKKESKVTIFFFFSSEKVDKKGTTYHRWKSTKFRKINLFWKEIKNEFSLK